MTRTAQDYGDLALLLMMWSTSFFFVAIAVQSVPPVLIAAGRIAIGAVILVAIMYGKGLRFPLNLRLWGFFAVIGVTGNVAPFFLISWGQTMVPSGLAGMIMGINPLVVLLLAHFFTDDRALTPRRTAGFLVGFAGLALLTGPAGVHGLGDFLWHELAILCGAFLYAVNAVITRRMPPVSPVVSGAATLLMGSLVILPISWVSLDVAAVSPRPSSLAAVAALGIWSTALPTLVFFRIILSAGPTFMSYINYILPVLATMWGMVLLGERYETTTGLALAAVLAGLALANSGVPRRVRERDASGH